MKTPKLRCHWRGETASPTRRGVAGLAGLAAAAVLLYAAAGVAAEEANRLTNPSFEEPAEGTPQPAGWSGDPAVYRRDAAVARTGSASLRFANDDPARYRLAGQRVPLEPGRTYRFSGWVKTENLAGPDSGATFCIEWSDRDGKWLGGSYPSGISGTSDWTRISGMAHVPDDAGASTFSCYVRRGMTGTAWFDDVEVVRIVRPPLRSVVASPVYRGRIAAEGPATIRALARLDLREGDAPPAELRIRSTLTAASGGPPLGQVERTPSGEQGAGEPIAIELPAGELAPGDYRLEIALLDAQGETLQTDGHDLVRLPGDFAPRRTIDEHRRLLVDGRPFFPLGMYWGGIDEADLRVYAQSKFNCLMPYGSPNRRQMDLAHDLGLKVIYSIKDWYYGSRWCPPAVRSVDDEEPMVRARVREFRDHPALLAWYLNDELPQTFMPQLEAHQRWVVEEDPHHPTWVVLYQVNEVSAYLNTFDVIGTDPYPIDRNPASMAAEWTAETFRQVERSRPMWQVPQVFNWANYAKTDEERSKGRTPTCEEIRSMAWQCIAEGATGLIFYSWYDLKRNPDATFDEKWSGLKRLAAEIDRMAPVILSIEPAEPIVAGDGTPPDWLHCLVRRHEGKLYLIAVNNGDGEGEVTFQLPAEARSIRETSSNRSIRPEGRVFSDRFAPLDVHLYEVEL